MEYLVSAKSRFNFEGNRGASVEVLLPAIGDDQAGFKSVKYRLTDYDLYSNFEKVPALYDLGFTMIPKSNQKVEQVVTQVKMLKDVVEPFGHLFDFK